MQAQRNWYRAVPARAVPMCSPALRLTQGACNSRAWMELLMQESCAHSLESSWIISREAKMPHVGSGCLHSFGVASKSSTEFILLGGCRIPLGVWVLQTSYSFILKVLLFYMPSTASADLSQPMSCLILTGMRRTGKSCLSLHRGLAGSRATCMGCSPRSIMSLALESH